MQIDAQLLAQIRSVTVPAIIAISGFGGSGKSSLAARIGEQMSIPVVSVDSFIKNRYLAHYSCWQFIDYKRLECEVLAPFVSGVSPVEFGHFDWAANAITSHRIIHDHQRCIVEGVGLLRPSLLPYFAFSIWIVCPIEEAIRRGKKRDREVYQSPQDENWDGLWRRNDEECYHLYRSDTLADYLFDNSSSGV